MNIKKLKILVIGAGSIGQRHIANMDRLGYREIIISDKEKPLLLRYRWYKSAQQALRKEHPDITFICAPTHLHIRYALLALDYKTHLFIEKPLSHSLTQINRLKEKAKKQKKIVFTACNYQFNRGWQKLNDVIKKRTFGEPLYANIAGGYYLPDARKHVNYKNVYASKTRGGGVILDSGIHSLDYCIAMFGPVTKIKAIKSKSKTIGIDAEEIAHLLFEHQSRVTVSLSLDYVSKKSFHWARIVTTQGTLLWNYNEDTIIFQSHRGTKRVFKGAKDQNQMFIDELRHFFSCVRTGAPTKNDIENAELTLKTALKAKRSASL